VRSASARARDSLPRRHRKAARVAAQAGRHHVSQHRIAAAKHNTHKEKKLFNKDALFGRKDENPSSDPRTANVTPDLRGAGLRSPAALQPETPARQGLGQPPQMQAPPDNEELAGSKLIVGPDIKLKGVEITDCDTLVVEGRVEASMDSRVVQIAQNGVFNGTATMDVAEIWGSFEGTLTARKQLVIYATGRVSGTIRYGKIRVEEGGEVTGEVSTLASGHASAARGESSAKPAAAGEMKGTSYKQQPVKA
jgi:cytoskeletal protein CcmA (bactofilin family)